MSVETYWDQSYYPGMGGGDDPDPPTIAPAIATPADGSEFADGAQVVFTGTSEPNASIAVQVWDATSWTTLTTTTASGDGVWTTDPYTVDAQARVALRVTAYDGVKRSGAVNLSVTPAQVLVAPGDVVDTNHDGEQVEPDPATAWEPGESALFGDGEFHWGGHAWLAGPAPAPEPAPEPEPDDPEVAP